MRKIETLAVYIRESVARTIVKIGGELPNRVWKMLHGQSRLFMSSVIGGNVLLSRLTYSK